MKEKGLQHTRHKIKCGSPGSKLPGKSHTVTPAKPRLKDAATKNSSTAPFLDIWLQTSIPLCSLNGSISQRRQEVSLATDLNTCKSCQWWPFLLCQWWSPWPQCQWEWVFVEVCIHAHAFICCWAVTVSLALCWTLSKVITKTSRVLTTQSSKEDGYLSIGISLNCYLFMKWIVKERVDWPPLQLHPVINFAGHSVLHLCHPYPWGLIFLSWLFHLQFSFHISSRKKRRKTTQGSSMRKAELSGKCLSYKFNSCWPKWVTWPPCCQGSWE